MFCLLPQLIRGVVMQPSASGTAAAAAATPEQQTSDQPAVTQSEAKGSSSPVDLSNKKSPEAESTIETLSSSSAAAATQGKHP